MARKGTLRTNTSSRTTVNIRFKPDGDEIKTERPSGTKVSVTAESAPDSRGHSWYKISYGDTANDVGWVRDDVITLEPLSSASPETSASPLEANTRLYFETGERIIRVFEEDGQLRLNVYNKVSNKTHLNKVSAIRLPDVVSMPSGADISWHSYVSRQDEKVYIVRFVPLRQTELIISHALNGEVFVRTLGFSSRGTAYTQAN